LTSGVSSKQLSAKQEEKAGWEQPTRPCIQQAKQEQKGGEHHARMLVSCFDVPSQGTAVCILWETQGEHSAGAGGQSSGINLQTWTEPAEQPSTAVSKVTNVKANN